MDDLTYHYKGNTLRGVDDALSCQPENDFTDNGHYFSQGTEYLYDDNGNMITDKNKGIDITYNALNLPEVVTFGDGRKIKCQYSAGGTKLKKTVYDGEDSNPVLTKHYEAGFVYKNNNLETFPTKEGRVRKTNNGLRYEYDLKDHLGNVRATFTKDLDKDGRPDLQQADTYYPFGLKIAGMGEVNGPENKFTYNGKELEDEFGLNWYHYGARYYDPQVSRWHAVDAADEFVSAYIYVSNDPVNLVDKDGNMSCCLDMSAAYLSRQKYAVRNGLDPIEFEQRVGRAQLNASIIGISLFAPQTRIPTLIQVGFESFNQGKNFGAASARASTSQLLLNSFKRRIPLAGAVAEVGAGFVDRSLRGQGIFNLGDISIDATGGFAGTKFGKLNLFKGFEGGARRFVAGTGGSSFFTNSTELGLNSLFNFLQQSSTTQSLPNRQLVPQDNVRVDGAVINQIDGSDL